MAEASPGTIRRSSDFDVDLWARFTSAVDQRPGTIREAMERSLELWLEVSVVPEAFVASSAREALEAWCKAVPPWEE